MKILYLIFLFCLLLLSSCGGSLGLVVDIVDSDNLSPQDETSAYTSSSTPHLTPTSTVTNKPTLTPITPMTTSTPTATITPTLTPTITPTPRPLNQFFPSGLKQGVSPVAYLENDCRYLEYRWGEDKSHPGTIVVPIMFHSILKPGREITDSSSISREYFEYFMGFAKDMGFSTITVDELVDFLEVNQKIPERSMILILDDRRPGATELFMPYLEENDWTLTLAWPTTDETRESLWMQMEMLAESGRLDVQSHGHDHIYIQDYTPMEEVEEEIYRPIEVIQDHFGTTPASIIWPGGNFTKSALELAREAGLKLGFTVYSRGPLMFNWIPLGEPEKEMDDPLLVLPRYWSTAADVALMQAVEISEGAKAEGKAVKAEELRYYSLYCQSGEGE